MSQISTDDFGKMVIRNPLYSYHILFDEENKTKNLNDLIWEYLEDEKFLEAIFWSSKQLYATILDLKNKDLPEKKKSKILLTVKKYLIRSSSRSTPYGTFAGTTIQNIKDKNSGKIKSQKKKLRLDIAVIRKIIRSIEDSESLSPYLNYTLNNTIYSFDSQFRYLEIDKYGNKGPQITSLEKNEILNFVYSKRIEGTITFDTIFKQFSNNFGKQDLSDFFDELIESGFLVSELTPTQTDDDELRYIREFLGRSEVTDFPEAHHYKHLLQSVSQYISDVENSAFGDFNKNDLKNITDLFDRLKITLADEQIFHIDVLNNCMDGVGFSEKDLKNLKEAVSVLSKITVNNLPGSQLRNFKKIFSEKYDTAPVSIMEVLDPEIGIGFPANENIGSFSNNEFIAFNKKNIQNISKSNHNLSEWLIDKIENLSIGEAEIKINSIDLQNIPSIINSLSNSFNFVGQVLNSDRILLQSVGGAHANTLLSRFAYMSSEIQSLCKSISLYEKEISGEVVFAEIIWIPDGREANITRKFSYNQYEIPIYYKSSLPLENQIHINDILISVENNEIILISKKLKKRIIPRLSNAHNFMAGSNSVYQFLCSIQDQNFINLAVMPDFLQTKKRFFPRISFKNIILYQASWIFQETDVKLINNSQHPL